MSTAKAVINSLRSYGPSSLTFVVTINQTLHTTQGTSQGSTQWASHGDQQRRNLAGQ